jgi:glycerophosphoryl diester phosphodiesterase
LKRIPILPGRPRPLVFAHRGCSSLAPENTIAAFAKAREKGSPGIELDVHPSADGKLVVMHDGVFLRTMPEGGARRPEDLPYEQIRRFDAGSWFAAEFSGERPPLLADVLDAFCPGMYADIELKSRATKGDPLPGLLAECLASQRAEVRAALTVSSFNPVCLAAFQKAWAARAPVPTAVIFSAGKDVPWLLRRGLGRVIAGCDYLKPERGQVSARSRACWTLLEQRSLVAWTVDRVEEAAVLFGGGPLGIPGCTGIVTNRPQDMARLWNR